MTKKRKEQVRKAVKKHYYSKKDEHGMVRMSIWIYPEWRESIKNFVKSLAIQRDKK